MACDGSRRLWILDFARARPRSSHSNTGVSYLLYILTTGKISLSHFEVTDPDGICCQPDIFTGCQIVHFIILVSTCVYAFLAPNCPLLLSWCHIVQVPYCPSISHCHCTVNPVTSICSHAVVKDLRLQISGSWSMFITCLELAYYKVPS